jgi:DNA polymerase-3 subunit alpha
MEECKRMGLHVLGPDINESKKGFSVNANGDIRFGMSGLKGVGEAAIESLIKERAQNGPYLSVFDLVKRVNQRTVNKRTLENLVYAGAFDCFQNIHRGQYFYKVEGEQRNSLEKIIGWGQTQQSLGQDTQNTLFGNLATAIQVPEPKIPPCEPWTLTELLDHEKEITGMFMSGHPLDHFKFEIAHYGITSMEEFNEIRDLPALQANPNKLIRLAGLITEVRHKVTKTGRNYGSFTMEDFTGKSEFTLWGEDYVRHVNYLEKGKNLFITGAFRTRWGRESEYEFKPHSILLLESIKPILTRQLIIHIEARHLAEPMIQFLEKNTRKYKGRTGLKFNIKDSKTNQRICLVSLEEGIEMNDELAGFLSANPEMEVEIISQ